MSQIIFKPFNPHDFAPCIVKSILVEKPIRLSERVLCIRNKRHRERLAKRYIRMGIRTFLAPAFEISKQ